MAIQSQPSRISEPFAGSGTKNVIPATNATPSASQAASWASGFPPECSQPISAGGCPVPRNDMNGVLNWLSQGFAFGQDGGVWEWSALADYDTQRIVRGSDGLLYWSVAQSGPGIAAGAQDPTADNGTYWSTMPMLTPPLADKSNKTATTEWVKNLALAPVYVDPAGDDANDGFSASTPKKTLQAALDLAVALPHGGAIDAKIIVAAGSYSGDISVDQARCVLDLQGSATIAGGIDVKNSGALIANGSSYTLTVTPPSGTTPISVSYGSTALLYTSLQITAISSSNAVLVISYSLLFCASAINISSTSVSEHAISISHSSLCDVRGQITMDNGSAGGIYILGSSCGHFIRGLKQNGAYSSGYGVYTERNSSCYIYGGQNIIYGGPDSCLSARYGSSIEILANSVAPVEIIGSGNSLLYSGDNASINLIIDGSNVLKLTSNNSEFCVRCEIGAIVHFSAAGSAVFNGSVSDCVCNCVVNGSIRIPYAIGLSGTMTGKRYNAERGGQISVAGAGANKIPGTVAGTVTAASYGYYS